MPSTFLAIPPIRVDLLGGIGGGWSRGSAESGPVLGVPYISVCGVLTAAGAALDFSSAASPVVLLVSADLWAVSASFEPEAAAEPAGAEVAAGVFAVGVVF